MSEERGVGVASASVARPSWIGSDCPPEWRKVGTIDVADPADVSWALERDYRIGAIYDGMSHSVAEPCAADIYEEVSAGPYTCIRCLAGTWNDSDICDDCLPSPTPEDEAMSETKDARYPEYDPGAVFRCSQGCGKFRRDRCGTFRGRLHCPVCRYIGTLAYVPALSRASSGE